MVTIKNKMKKLKFLLTMVVILSAFVSIHAEEPNTTDYFYINDFTIAPGETKEIELCLYSTQPYRSFQVNIYMPEGLEIVFDEDEYEYIIPSDRIPSRNWPYQSDFVADGSLLVSAYSSNNRVPIDAGDGALFTMKVKASENLSEDCVIQLKESEITGHVAPYVNYAFYGPDTECVVRVCRTASLPEVVSSGIVDARYKVSDNLTCVYVSADGKTVYAKDAGGFALRDQEPYQPSAAQSDSQNPKIFDSPGDFDQSNWVALNFKEEITTSRLEELMSHKVTVTGVLKNKLNPEIDVDEIVANSEDAATYEPNLYTIASFVEGNTYFVMPPKPQEYVNIHWAVYKKSEDGSHVFYMPKSEGNVNTEKLHGAVKACLDKYEGAAFEDNKVYELTAIVKALKPRVSESDATLLATENVDVQDSELSQYYEIYPLTSSTDDYVTGISNIVVNSEDETYYNLLGQPVTNPAPGIYIHKGKKVIVK